MSSVGSMRVFASHHMATHFPKPMGLGGFYRFLVYLFFSGVFARSLMKRTHPYPTSLGCPTHEVLQKCSKGHVFCMSMGAFQFDSPSTSALAIVLHS